MMGVFNSTNKTEAGRKTEGSQGERELRAHRTCVTIPAKSILQRTLEDSGGREQMAGEIAQLVKCLPYKQEDMSLVPRTNIKKMSVVANACNHSSQETEPGRCLGPAGQPA